MSEASPKAPAATALANDPPESSRGSGGALRCWRACCERRRGESRGDVRGETTFFFRGSGFFSLEPEELVEVTEGHLAGSSLGCWERRWSSSDWTTKPSLRPWGGEPPLEGGASGGVTT